MKIALIVPGGVDRSGEYRVIPVLLALIRRLASRHEVHVFAFSQEAAPGRWELLGACIHNVGCGLTRPRALQAILREHRAGSFRMVHSIWSGACGLVAVAASRILRIPSVVHVAGGELVSLPQIGYGGGLQWRGRLREAAVLRAASVVTAASAPMIESIASLGVPAKRLPLGVDLREWPSRAPQRRDIREPARLIHVASLNPVKDQTTLLRALAVLAAAGMDFRMEVVGEDTLHGAMQALAIELGLHTRVRFHGFLTQRQLRPVVEAAHLLVMSSLHEAGPIALLEAAVVGVPTAGTAVGHIAEWAPSAAVAVGAGNPQQLAMSIRSLLIDDDLRLRIARAAFDRATTEDADYTAVQVQRLYDELVGAA